MKSNLTEGDYIMVSPWCGTQYCVISINASGDKMVFANGEPQGGTPLRDFSSAITWVKAPSAADVLKTIKADEPLNARTCGECDNWCSTGENRDGGTVGRCRGRHLYKCLDYYVANSCQYFTEKSQSTNEPVAVEDVTPGWYFAVTTTPGVETKVPSYVLVGVRDAPGYRVSGHDGCWLEVAEWPVDTEWYHAPSPEQLMAMCDGESKEDLHADLTEVYRRCRDLEARNDDLLGQLTLLRKRIATSVTKLRTIKEAEALIAEEKAALCVETCGECGNSET